jgi:asparagine synthase (glutamine-hydrolysing)
MCGLAGYLDSRAVEDEATMRTRLLAMADALLHRGPDDGDVWCDPAHGIGFAHRRLAVVDLSAAGHQPMRSAGGRYVMAYNGEIYNWGELRAAIDAESPVAWRGHSDTEVILAAIDAWGVRRTLESLVGMFALALWDSRERTLTLARDRLGEKPLYYGHAGDVLLFGSELKPLRTHPAFRNEVDRGALVSYARFGYVPAPLSIHRGLAKLPAGHYAEVTARGAVTLHEYWSARDVALRGVAEPLRGSRDELAGELDRLLRQAIAGQMIADVPLGAFLSGGIDSSTVVALMQALSPRPIRTFTIGFQEESYDEAPHARAVAQHLGTDHTELYVTPAQARDVIPRLPAIYDEPFADSSQIPTFLVCELARRHVTVALSGDGGDELFGGYRRYLIAQQAWGRLALLPVWLRARMAAGIRAVSPARWNSVLGLLGPLLPARFRHGHAGDSAHKLAEILALRGRTDVYLRLISQWQEPAQLVAGAAEPAVGAVTALHDETLRAGLGGALSHMMYLDLATYLPDDILVKVDRAAMAISLETRVPMLDHRLVEFAWRVPVGHKTDGRSGKLLLRSVLHRYVPPQLVERPKMGFGVPIDAWLRGPLRDWAEHLLDPARLARDGFFNAAPVTAMWRSHLDGRRQWQYPLWVVLMFQAWLDDTHAR